MKRIVVAHMDWSLMIKDRKRQITTKTLEPDKSIRDVEVVIELWLRT